MAEETDVCPDGATMTDIPITPTSSPDAVRLTMELDECTVPLTPERPPPEDDDDTEVEEFGGEEEEGQESVVLQQGHPVDGGAAVIAIDVDSMAVNVVEDDDMNV